MHALKKSALFGENNVNFYLLQTLTSRLCRTGCRICCSCATVSETGLKQGQKRQKL